MSRLVVPALLAMFTPACADRAVTEVVPIPENAEHLEFSVEMPPLDILFVVDDSGSMEREQDQITENFHRMIEVLETLPTGLPSLHIGVVSTDMGAGEACGSAPSPGPGVLRNAPQLAGCSAPSDRWISDTDDDGDGVRTRNYSGALADSFACIAALGTGGCGFEQPLEAMRTALDPDTLANTGFLREGSLLAVVFLTDEDDCSVFDPQLFTTSTDEPFGPVENFRCFEQGIDCEGIDPRTLGVRENCVPRDDSAYVTPVADYVAALKALRPRDSQLIVAGIMGDAGPVEVIHNERGHLDIKRSCDIGTSDPQGAFPPIRTDAFLSSFTHNARTRICDADLSPAVVAVADQIKVLSYGRCVQKDLVDARPDLDGLQVDCSVTELQHPGTAEEITAILPPCVGDPEATTKACWTLEENAAICTTSDHHLEVATYYPADVVREADTIIQAQCRTATN